MVQRISIRSMFVIHTISYLVHLFVTGGGGVSDRTASGRHVYCVCVCVCMCFHPIYSGRQPCARTSRGHTAGRSHIIFHSPSFCGACLNFHREKDSAFPFPRRPWIRTLCIDEFIALHLLGMTFFVFFVYFCFL